jgi:hypothetical protein
VFLKEPLEFATNHKSDAFETSLSGIVCSVIEQYLAARAHGRKLLVAAKSSGQAGCQND